MRCGTADGVGRLGADRQIDVGAVGVERVVPGQVQFGASLPPAVPCREDAVGQCRVEMRPRAHPATRRRDRQPIALADITSGRGRRADLSDGIGLQPAQLCQVGCGSRAASWLRSASAENLGLSKTARGTRAKAARRSPAVRWKRSRPCPTAWQSRRHGISRRWFRAARGYRAGWPAMPPR